MSRRALSLAAALALATAAVVRAEGLPHHEHALVPALRLQLEQGEARLRAGDVVGAERLFDGVALQAHDGENEVALVRTYMQAGDYRRAVAFAAHAAGAHADMPAATALYAWLLGLGGQGIFALRVLDPMLQKLPDDPLLLATRKALAGAWPQQLPASLSQGMARAAPYATGVDPAPGARLVGTAVLLGAGHFAVVPSASLDAASASGALWLRNGLGRTVPASPLRSDAALGLTLLALHAALPVPDGLQVVPRVPFAGSPALMVEYALAPNPAPAAAAWPSLKAGFFGRFVGSDGSRSLGIDAESGARGGPVFDGNGRLAGMAVPDVDGTDRLVSVEKLQSLLPADALHNAPVQSREAPSIEASYEAALRLSLQVLAAPQPAAR